MFSFSSNTACSPKCKTCSGPSDSDCIECPDFKINNKGKCDCPNGYDDGTICKDCNENCTACNGSAQNCTSCLYSFSLINGQCLCPAAHLYDLGICLRCHYSCTACNSTEVDGCTECPTGRILENSKCLCGNLTEEVPNQPTCKKKNLSDLKLCPPGCKTCDSINSCQVCFEGFQEFELNSERICKCPEGFFNNMNTCQKCHINCGDCSGPGPSECLSNCSSDTRGNSGFAVNGDCSCGKEFEEVFDIKCQLKSSVQEVLEAFQSSAAKTSGVASSVSAVSGGVGGGGGGGGIGILGILEVSQIMSLSENLKIEFPLSLDKKYLSSLSTLRMDNFFNVSSGNDTKDNTTSSLRRMLSEEPKTGNRQSKLVNTLFTMGLNVITIVITVAVIVISKVIRNYRMKSFFEKTLSVIRWRLFFCIFRITTIAQILFIFTELSSGKESSFMSISGRVWALLMLTFHILIFLFTFYVINFENFENDNIKDKYGFLVEGIDSIFLTKKNYFIISLLRKVFYCAIFVVFSENISTQIFCLVGNQFFFIIYVIVTRPFYTNSHQWLQVAFETFLLAFYLAIAILVRIEDNQAKIMVGWIIIAILIVTQLSMLVAALLNLGKTIRNILFKKDVNEAAGSLRKAKNNLAKRKGILQNDNGSQTIIMNRLNMGRKPGANVVSLQHNHNINTFFKTPTYNLEAEYNEEIYQKKENLEDDINSRRSLMKARTQFADGHKNKPESGIIKTAFIHEQTATTTEKFKNASMGKNFKKQSRQRASRFSEFNRSKTANTEPIDDRKIIEDLIEQDQRLRKIYDNQYLENFHKKIEMVEIALDENYNDGVDPLRERELPCDAIVKKDGLVKGKTKAFLLENGFTVTVLKLFEDVGLAEIVCEEGEGFVEVECLEFES